MIVVVCFQSPVPFFVTPWTAALQASLSFTISLSLLRLMSTEAVMPSNHLILCGSFLILSSIFSSIRKRVGSSHQDNGSVLLHLLIYMCYFLTRRNQLLYYYSPQCYGNNRTLKGCFEPLLWFLFPYCHCYSFYTGFYIEERQMITFLPESFLKPFLKLSIVIQALTYL